VHRQRTARPVPLHCRRLSRLRPSKAAPGYRFTPAEHAGVVEQLVLRLDLRGVTMMVQDWGGPIGFAVATRHPERFAAFVIGNTWAWPKADPPTRLFSREILGSRPFLADVERGLPALRDRPALLVWPTGDVAFGDRERRRWEEVFPDHRTVALEGAGHYIQEDAAGEIVAAIRGWR
jgi:haloalkane dehalogenase